MSGKKIAFNINYQKSLEVILFIIERLGGQVDKYRLMKIIFQADKYHLNMSARPVTGDYYKRMPYGTVPYEIYNMTKGAEGENSAFYLNHLGFENFPFTIEKTGKNHFIKSSRKSNQDYLSESDIEAIENGITEYSTNDFSTIESKNHKEKCWLETPAGQIIPFELMIDDKEIIEELQEISSLIVI